jgi:hypothetical protein
MSMKRKGLSLIELVFAMFMLAIAIVSLAYVFADAMPNILRSRMLSQGAFLAQSIMEISLLAEPLEPVADSSPAAQQVDCDPYRGFSYRVFVDRYALVNAQNNSQDTSFNQIVVQVFHEHVAQGAKPIATCVALRKIGGRSTLQAGISPRRAAFTGPIPSMLITCLRKEECLQCSR